MKRQKAKPTPQMPSEQAMLGIDGRPRGSVDGPKGKDILGDKDIPGIQTFVGRSMRGGFRSREPNVGMAEVNKQKRRSR
jgi:hypothetical protein